MPSPLQPPVEAKIQACPVCEAPPGLQSIQFCKGSLVHRGCQSCGMVCINPRPERSWLDGHYQMLADEYFLDPAKLESDFRPGRFDVEFEALGPTPGRLLDVGCADGAFVKEARDRGIDAIGIDIMASAVEHGRSVHALDLEYGDFTDGHLDPASFDTVTMWATVEHLANPGTYLDQAYRVLRPYGRLAMTVPNMKSLTQRLLGHRDRYVCVEHLNYFPPTTFTTLVVRHGFFVERSFTRKINPKTILQDLLARPGRQRQPDELLSDQVVTDKIKTAKIFAPVRAAHRALEAGVAHADLGDGLYVVARKRSDDSQVG